MSLLVTLSSLRMDPSLGLSFEQLQIPSQTEVGPALLRCQPWCIPGGDPQAGTTWLLISNRVYGIRDELSVKKHFCYIIALSSFCCQLLIVFSSILPPGVNSPVSWRHCGLKSVCSTHLPPGLTFCRGCRRWLQVQAPCTASRLGKGALPDCVDMLFCFAKLCSM